MLKRSFLLLSLALLLPAVPAWADEYTDTVKVFQNAGQSAGFFKTAYGYAVFPTIAKGGIGVGAAYGTGRVVQRGRHVGNTSMTQVSLGLQLGGQAYRQIIFFENEEAFRQFTSGNFEFSAEASAIAITVGASAKATTTGTSAGASASQQEATTAGKYHRGMAIFTVAKGGLMYEAVVAGQKFSYEKLK